MISTLRLRRRIPSRILCRGGESREGDRSAGGQRGTSRIAFCRCGWVQTLFCSILRYWVGPGSLLLVPDCTLGLGYSERGAFEVEAEERVGEEIVQRRPGAVPIVG